MSRAFMIAVTGGSGSGKTTLARALSNRLGEATCQLVTEDNYYFGRDHYGPTARAMSHAELESTFNFDDPANKDMAHLRSDIEALKRWLDDAVAEELLQGCSAVAWQLLHRLRAAYDFEAVLAALLPGADQGEEEDEERAF